MAPALHGPRLCGIPVTIDPSWLPAAALIVLAAGASAPARLGAATGGARLWPYLGGAAIVLALFGTILLHELAHAIVARWCGLPVQRITIHCFGGAVESDTRDLSPRGDALLGAGGLLASGLLAAFCGGWWWLARGGGLGARAPQLLALASGAVFALALLPGYPLDGGRIIRALLWYVTDDLFTATRLASLYGQALAWCLLVGGALLAVGGAPLWGLGLVCGGWLLHREARRGYRDLLWREWGRRIPVVEAAFVRPPRIPASRQLDEAIDDLLEGLGRRNEGGPSVVVDDGGRVIGVLGLDQVRGFKRSRWRTTTAGDAMLPRARVPALPQDLPLVSALAELTAGRHGYALVVATAGDDDADTAPIGVVTPRRLIRHLSGRLREGHAALTAGNDATAGRA